MGAISTQSQLLHLAAGELATLPPPPNSAATDHSPALTNPHPLSCSSTYSSFSLLSHTYTHAVTPLLHHSVTLIAPHAASQAAMVTLASLLTAGLSLGSVMFFGARQVWESIEPWLTAGYTQAAEPASLYGVDVTGSQFFSRPAVQRAVDFAAKVHAGQIRRTREPYVVHCIETARIVEGLLAPGEDDERAEAAIVAAVLHDTIDDAGVDPQEIHRRFGPLVGTMVAKVSQLSATNQLVRRRFRLSEALPTAQEEAQLRHMILTMVAEPLVIVIKLADRLHNMRTVYALSPVKQRAVAEETRRVWCSLAERLGMFALRSELEDLCFAVLQPLEYRALRADLDELWGVQSIAPAAMTPEDCCLSGECECHTDLTKNQPCGGVSTVATTPAPSKRSGGAAQWLGASQASVPSEDYTTDSTTSNRSNTITANSKNSNLTSFLSAEQIAVKELIDSVLPFDASTFNMERLNIPPSARRGLEILQGCARALLQEITTEGVASGLEVSVQGRVKSLYSTFKKMARKGVPLSQVYDSRALRVVVDDFNGAAEAEAIAACYRLLPAVHRMWRRVPGEEDDYIAMPKESGYQSLHTAVMGPGGIPMEVQIRTANMHSVAEYGTAAHWVYKERPGDGPSLPPSPTTTTNTSTSSSTAIETATDFSLSSTSTETDENVEEVAVGRPVLRILPAGQVTDGVVVSSEANGLRLLIAASLEPRGLAAAAGGVHASPQQYASLTAYVDSKGWFAAGQGDLKVEIEQYVMCSDGKYHRVDRFGRKLPTTAVLLQPQHYVQHMSSSDNDLEASPSSSSSSATTAATAADQNQSQNQGQDEDAAFMSERIRLLRSMLDWGADLKSADDTTAPVNAPSSATPANAPSSSKLPLPPELRQSAADQALASEVSPPDVMILLWPTGVILRAPRGTTAGEVLRKETGGAERAVNGRHVNVNNRLVPEATKLQDGDFVVLTRETVKV